MTLGEAEQKPPASTTAMRNAWGEWQWSEAAAQAIMEDCGFTEGAISVMPVFSMARLAKATKPGDGT